MTDDFKPVSEMSPRDPLPFDEERDIASEPDASEAVFHPHDDVQPEETSVAVGGWETQTATPILARIRQIFWVDIGGIAERIRHLDAAIENAADTPSNYVLRGELYLSTREYALARRDFQRAYELATAQFQQSDWGLMAQAMQDRALAGLQKAEKRLRTNGE
ncbi:MAG: hypothetical protein K8I30_23850 [Anaerolineae bacterium]|nr:hypothetical protein [Anaerolineae bacterium]